MCLRFTTLIAWRIKQNISANGLKTLPAVGHGQAYSSRGYAIVVVVFCTPAPCVFLTLMEQTGHTWYVYQTVLYSCGNCLRLTGSDSEIAQRVRQCFTIIKGLSRPRLVGVLENTGKSSGGGGGTFGNSIMVVTEKQRPVPQFSYRGSGAHPQCRR